MIITKKALLIGIVGIAIAVLIISGVSFAVYKTHVSLAGLMGERKIPIYRVDTAEPKIAVTFNAAWEADEIPEILAVLEKYNAKCTFFVVGSFAEKNPEAINMIARAGHEIANHSDTHPDMTSISEGKIRSQISGCENKVKAICLKAYVPLFRAPSGAYNNALVNTAEEMGYQVIQWDVDSHDWQEHITAESLTNYCFSKTRPGSILLFHVGTKRGYTPKLLPYILETLQKQGLSFVKVSELVYPNDGRSKVDHEGTQHSQQLK
jgi:peptidoglycan/xylan/chitin deacetylase (PgdA/CDA1 family)